MNNKLKRISALLSSPKGTKRPPVFVYLGYLLVATILVTGVTFSGYISTTSGDDSARVAKFEITETDLDGLLTTTLQVNTCPGTTSTKTIKVKNDSEVTVDYTVSVVNLYQNLPLDFWVNDDSANKTQGSYSFTDALAPGDSKDFELSISWPEGANSTFYVGKVDTIEVTVSAIQKD